MSQPKIKLSPPQYQLWRELSFSFGSDPEIAVKPPYEREDQVTIDVRVMNNDRASAVAGVLTESYNFGGIQVRVRVLNEEGSVVPPPLNSPPGITVLQMIRTALLANPYFERVFRIEPRPATSPMGDLAVVFLPQVIEFWNDNLADPFGYMHFVAQDVFADVMKKSYDGVTLSFTSTPRETVY